MDNDFRDWWMNGGSEAWARALDGKGGTLNALEMVFNSGKNQASRYLEDLQEIDQEHEANGPR